MVHQSVSSSREGQRVKVQMRGVSEKNGLRFIFAAIGGVLYFRYTNHILPALLFGNSSRDVNICTRGQPYFLNLPKCHYRGIQDKASLIGANELSSPAGPRACIYVLWCNTSYAFVFSILFFW